MKSSPSSSILLLRWWFLATASSISMLVVPSLGQSSSSSSCPGFRLGTTSCTGIFSDSSLVASCPSNDNDVVAVSGTFVATSDFDETARVTFVPCLRVVGFCFESYAQDGGSLCDLVTNKNDDGDDSCGSASTYSIDERFDVPKEAKDYSWAMGFVTIKVFVDNEEACSQDAYEENNNTTSAFMATGISMASLFAVGGLGLYFVRRRRKPLLVLEGGGLFGEGNEHGFVTMMDLTPSVSSIGIKGAFTVEGFV